MLKVRGRPDPCVLPRAVPIVEAMLALVLVEQFMIAKSRSTIGFERVQFESPENVLMLSQQLTFLSDMRFLSRLFNIDDRALAAFRILAGVLLIVDICVRITDFRAHYTNFGVMPFDVVRNQLLLPMHFTFHLNDTLTGVLFAAVILAALCLILNFQTRFAVFISWLLLVSLQHRNPLVIQGGDTVLRLYMFWGLFLPLHRSFRRPARKSSNSPLFTIASAAMLLQICEVYWFSVALKSHAAWRVDFSAVYYALNLEQYASALGRWLLSFKPILPVLTVSTLIAETLFPLIALVAFRYKRLKLFAVWAMMLLHVFFGLAFELGTFPYISIIGWVFFLPAIFWDSLEMRVLKIRRATSWGKSALMFFRNRPGLLNRAPQILHHAAIACVVVCTLLAFLWNMRTLNIIPRQENWPRVLDLPVHILRLDQFWGMFGPRPPSEDGWFVAPAESLKENTIIDAITGLPVTWDKPVLGSTYFKNDKWRKYMNNLTYTNYAPFRKNFGDYLCRRWAAEGKLLGELRVFYMMESTVPELGKGPVKKYELVKQRCALPTP